MVQLLITLILQVHVIMDASDGFIGTFPLFKDNREQASTLLDLERRTLSFKGWNGLLLPKDLAIAGFRYTGTSNMVQCDSCGLKLHKWVHNDNPVQAHKLYSPDCNFIKNWFTTQTDFTTRSQPEFPKPGYPEYREYQQRLDSFREWPNANWHQSPSKMASAGFFFNGLPDRVKCFQCGLGLRDWDDCDYPLACHKEWAPNCPFINHDNHHHNYVPDTLQARSHLDVKKKQENVALTVTSVPAAVSTDVEKKPDKDVASSVVPSAASDKGVFDSKNGTDTNSSVGSEVSNDIDSNRIDWNSPMIQAVLEMGCSAEVLQKVILENREKNGQDFKNATSLYMAILDFV